MSAASLVTFGRFPGFSWIKTSGKGNFLCSSAIKRIAEKEVDEGAKTVVLDLEECPAMDSTFMGTIAGVAEMLEERHCKRLQVTGLTESTERSLDTLGIIEMVDSEPEEADWQNQKDEIRTHLSTPDTPATPVDKGRHVLEAHETLCKVHQPNEEKFATVLEMLRPQVNK